MTFPLGLTCEELVFSQQMCPESLALWRVVGWQFWMSEQDLFDSVRLSAWSKNEK
jgi:hypothetical protein